MASGYTRQSTAEIVTGQVIEASDFNNEFNQILAAFDASTGHDHSGGTGLAPPISLTLTNTGVTGILDAKFGGIKTSASDPTATDDTPDYVVGSIWVNTTSKAVFQCTDNTSTAAKWVRRQAKTITGATTLPATTDDVTAGYLPGHLIVNLTQGVAYICLDNTASAAIWVSLGVGRTGSGTVDPTVNEDANDGYRAGSIYVNTATQATFTCISATVGAASWVQTSADVGQAVLQANLFLN